MNSPYPVDSVDNVNSGFKPFTLTTFFILEYVNNSLWINRYFSVDNVYKSVEYL